MKRLILVTTAILGTVAACQAGVRFNIGLNVPLPGFYPAPVVVQVPVCPPVPRPVYVPPAPVVCYQPAPIVAVRPFCSPPPRHYHSHHHGFYGARLHGHSGRW